MLFRSLEYENKFLLFNSNDIEQISRLIVSLYHDENLRNNLSMINSVNIKKFDKAVVKDMMYKIYKELYEID